jgi:hypothetical protein
MKRIAIFCPFGLLVGAVALSFAPQALAQTPASPDTPTTAPAPAPASSPDAAPAAASAAATVASGKLVLKEGSDVDLKFNQDLSSKTANEGDPVVLVLDQDLTVDNMVVARAGCKAYGEVTHAKRAGMMGKGGELNMRLDYVKIGDTKVMLRGSKGREGDDKTGPAVALTVLFGPIGLIKHGKEIEIKQGTPLKAYVADDVTLPPLPAPTS